MNIKEVLKQNLSIIRSTKPLILNITNYVTMDFVANALLSLGSTPLMTVFNKEIEELVLLSSAVNINIGTLDDVFIDCALSAAKFAQKHNKPVILDPTGAGATKLRTEAAHKILEYANVLKGNASEIISLSDQNSKTKGVDSTHTTDEAFNIAQSLALERKKTVFVSGKHDLITNGSSHKKTEGGNDKMTLVTGMGCALSGVVSSFCAANSNYYEACFAASTLFKLCGEKSKGTGPGEFKVSFIDTLFYLSKTMCD